MIALVAALAFLAGVAAGAAVTAWWGRRAPALDPGPAPPPAQIVQQPAAEEVPEQDLKPVLEATRGVVTELEQRYRGARAKGPEEPRPRSRTRPASNGPSARRRG